MRLDRFGLAHQAHGDRRDQRHGAFRAGQQAGEIVARQIGLLAAGLDDGAIGQHHFESQHVIGGDAVGQRVRAAGVFGDVAADGAGALAGGIGRVEVAVAFHRRGDIEIDHAGLERRRARSPGRFRECGSCARRRSMMPPSRGMAPPESPVPAPRPTMGSRIRARS